MVSSNTALLLPADAWLQYLPDELNGETATVTYHAWDTTSGVAEQKVSLAVTGGSTAFSTASDTGSIEVFPVNDAPELFARRTTRFDG